MIDGLGHSAISHPMELQGNKWSLEGTRELVLVRLADLTEPDSYVTNASEASLLLQHIYTLYSTGTFPAPSRFVIF